MKLIAPDVIETLALKFRTENDYSKTSAINLKSLLRKLDILTVYRPLSDTFYGMSLKSNNDAMFILVNSENPKGRQHFTIAHELYHLYYDENPHPHICNDGVKSISEKNADSFASALLMPIDGVLKFLSPEEIKTKKINLSTILKIEQYYSVSRSALLTRLKKTLLLSQKYFDELIQIPVKESARQYGYDTALYQKGNEGLVIGNFGEKARFLFEIGKISEGHYNELLNLIIKDE